MNNVQLTVTLLFVIWVTFVISFILGACFEAKIRYKDECEAARYVNEAKRIVPGCYQGGFTPYFYKETKCQ